MKGLLTFFSGGIWWQIPRPGDRAEGAFERTKLFGAVTRSTGCVGRSRPRRLLRRSAIRYPRRRVPTLRRRLSHLRYRNEDSAQRSDATGRLSRLKAAATAAYVTSPACVLRPFASAELGWQGALRADPALAK